MPRVPRVRRFLTLLAALGRPWVWCAGLVGAAVVLVPEPPGLFGGRGRGVNARGNVPTVAVSVVPDAWPHPRWLIVDVTREAPGTAALSSFQPPPPTPRGSEPLGVVWTRGGNRFAANGGFTTLEVSVWWPLGVPLAWGTLNVWRVLRRRSPPPE